ncbi:MAG: YbjN domain-containing protein [Azoarcus sp.]|nr:YbjN domain-containing protein [Azoarcus sp.]
MHRDLIRVLLSTVAFFTLASAACAQSQGRGSNTLVYATPNTVFSIAKEANRSAKLDSDGDGDPMITSQAEGIEYVVFFYDCTDGKDCKSLAFSASLDDTQGATLERLNTYNAEERYGKAFIDRDGKLTLDMDVEIEYGMSRRNLKEAFVDWEAAVRAFKKEVLASGQE